MEARNNQPLNPDNAPKNLHRFQDNSIGETPLMNKKFLEEISVKQYKDKEKPNHVKSGAAGRA